MDHLNNQLLFECAECPKEFQAELNRYISINIEKDVGQLRIVKLKHGESAELRLHRRRDQPNGRNVPRQLLITLHYIRVAITFIDSKIAAKPIRLAVRYRTKSTVF